MMSKKKKKKRKTSNNKILLLKICDFYLFKQMTTIKRAEKKKNSICNCTNSNFLQRFDL